MTLGQHFVTTLVVMITPKDPVSDPTPCTRCPALCSGCLAICAAGSPVPCVNCLAPQAFYLTTSAGCPAPCPSCETPWTGCPAVSTSSSMVSSSWTWSPSTWARSRWYQHSTVLYLTRLCGLRSWVGGWRCWIGGQENVQCWPPSCVDQSWSKTG